MEHIGEQEFRDARAWLQAELEGEPVPEELHDITIKYNLEEVEEFTIQLDETTYLWSQLLDNIRDHLGTYSHYQVIVDIRYSDGSKLSKREFNIEMDDDTVLAESRMGQHKHIVSIDVIIEIYTLTLNDIYITLPGMFYEFNTTYKMIMSELRSLYECGETLIFTVTNRPRKIPKKIIKEHTSQADATITRGDLIVVTSGVVDRFQQAFKASDAKSVFSRQIGQESASAYAEPCGATTFGCCPGPFPNNVITKNDEAGSNCPPPNYKVRDGGKHKQTRRKRKKQRKTRR
jgi:hypothetical protein